MIDEYLLKNSFILDSETIIHVFNEITHFVSFQPAPHRDFLWVGKSKMSIQEYENVDIQILGLKQKLQILHLYDVAYCEGFAANLVSFQQLWKLDYW